MCHVSRQPSASEGSQIKYRKPNQKYKKNTCERGYVDSQGHDGVEVATAASSMNFVLGRKQQCEHIRDDRLGGKF